MSRTVLYGFYAKLLGDRLGGGGPHDVGTDGI